MESKAAVASASSLRDSTNQGYVLSVLLHASVLALAWVSIPYFHRKIPETPPSLIVDLVPITDITAAPPPPSPEPAPVAPVTPPEPPAPAQAEAPPADTMPPPPQEQAPVKEPDKTPPPPKVKPTPKPQPPDTKKKDIAMLQDLLKNMEKQAPKPTPQAPTTNQKPSNNIAPNIAAQASVTEADAVQRHIEECWRIDPGQEGIQNLTADIKVGIDGSGRINRVEFLDMTRYFADDAFRRFANNIRISLLSCPPIPVAPERYSVFNGMTMTFSPQGRIN